MVGRIGTRSGSVLLALVVLVSIAATSCSSTPPLPKPTKPAPSVVAPEAGLVDVPARDVILKGQVVHLAATARLFYNLRPADDDAAHKPIFVLSNGFSARIVRAFGTGPTTVAEGGEVVDNPSSLTQIANLIYLDPRQSGFSYDVLTNRAPTAEDCGANVFNEYVDAADMLLATVAVLDAHPELTGDVVWVGESYAGVRIQWILAFLRDRWDLAPYDDPTLRSAIDKLEHKGSLVGGQILLQPWLLGRAHADAITAACNDPSLLSAVSSSVGAACSGPSACDCADAHGRSRYDFDYDVARQNKREYEAAQAHMLPSLAEKLLGVPLTSIAGLDAVHRSQGYKCNTPDSETPSDAELVALFGQLPAGQSYFIPYSPLQPGKEVQAVPADWDNQNIVAAAFIDNITTVPTFVSNGHKDLVVPTSALVPGLSALLGADHVTALSAKNLRVDGPSASGFIDLGDYPEAGHMITMLAADQLSIDLTGWLSERGLAR